MKTKAKPSVDTVQLKYFEAFSVLNGLSVLFEKEMPAKLAVKLFRISRPLKNLPAEYQEAIKVLKIEDQEVDQEKIAELNLSVFCEIEKINLNEFDSITISPSVLVQLEPILI